MFLQSLHLDYFDDYERCIGFQVVYSGPVATFFKSKQLRAFQQAELWQFHDSFAPHGQILDLLSKWDHNTPKTEKLLIHLLFAETLPPHPPPFHLGKVYNDSVVCLPRRISEVNTGGGVMGTAPGV